MRCSAAVAYLHPALERPNLTVFANSLALKVLFEHRRAVAVLVKRPGEPEMTLRADREVILSAGAYESPKLLMLSGVGPAAALPLFGIEVVEDLPVGQGLQDHLMTVINYLTDVESLMTALSPANLELLQTEGRGPLTSNIGEAGGFFRTRDDLQAPDVQFHVAPVLFHQQGLGVPDRHALTIGPCVLAPTSRGSVSLRSANPESAPRIVHGYLTTPEDRASILAGQRIALAIARQPALKAVITGPFEVPESESDEDLSAFARRTAMTLYHPTSSCAIGSVVDPELRVLGLENLRVVDASVMPSVPRGNTNAPTIMIAERAAELILGRGEKVAATT
jgi:choline dehydrogenase